MIPQRLHTRTLIELLHPQPSAQALIEITGLAPKTKPVKRYFTVIDVACEAVGELNDARYSVFLNLNPRRQMSGFEHDVPFVTCVGLDLQPERTDSNAMAQRLASAGIYPTARAVSGHGEHMYFRVQPSDPYKAKVVWERLCKFTVSDPVFNTNRIFRVPGTLNWKKDPPRWCYLTAVDPTRVYEIDQIDQALNTLGAPPPRAPKHGIPIEVDCSADWFELRKRLAPSVMDVLDTGEKNAYSERQVTRSEADWLVICSLIRAGASDEMIAWIYTTQPVRLLKYHEAGAHYLKHTIETARRATAEKKEKLQPSQIAVRFTGGSADEARGRRRVYW